MVRPGLPFAVPPLNTFLRSAWKEDLQPELSTGIRSARFRASAGFDYFLPVLDLAFLQHAKIEAYPAVSNQSRNAGPRMFMPANEACLNHFGREAPQFSMGCKRIQTEWSSNADSRAAISEL